VLVFSGQTEKNIRLTIPHTITDWVGSGFCVSSRSGVGVSDKFKVTAFQPFFVSFTLPYSLVRGERVAIPVSVFNYLSTGCLQVCDKNMGGHRPVSTGASGQLPPQIWFLSPLQKNLTGLICNSSHLTICIPSLHKRFPTCNFFASLEKSPASTKECAWLNVKIHYTSFPVSNP